MQIRCLRTPHTCPFLSPAPGSARCRVFSSCPYPNLVTPLRCSCFPPWLQVPGLGVFYPVLHTGDSPGVPVCPQGPGWGCSLSPFPSRPRSGLGVPVVTVVVGRRSGLGVWWLLGISVTISTGFYCCLPRVHVLGADPAFSRSDWSEELPRHSMNTCCSGFFSSAECWQPRRASPAVDHRPGDSREAGFPCFPLHPEGHRAGRPC